jgi:alpha-ribazole phosphatase
MHELTIWRHPKPRAVEGLCVGQTDALVDRRKSKRLAHRIRAKARRDGAARSVVTSPLCRSADVGRWLARWGWRHRIDPRLGELDFGSWEGQRWDDIARREIDAWCDNFAAFEPGGGESTTALLARCAAFLRAPRDASIVVGHAGWISAALWWGKHPDRLPTADAWPAAVRYGETVRINPAECPAASASSPAG